MKTLKIKPGALPIGELGENVRKRFNLKYEVTSNNRNEITIVKTKSIGCKIILTKKKVLISGTFPTPGSMMLAMGILILGGIIIPMAVYLIAYKGKFEAMEREVDEYVKAEFADRLG